MRFWKRKKSTAGGPGEIDCRQVMERLYEYIDEELNDDALVERIRAHLEVCQRCYPHYRFEKAFLRFLSQQRVATAPPELRRKIFQQILEEERSGG